MLENSEECKLLVHTVTEIVKADGDSDLAALLVNSHIIIEQTSYDNWNGGTYIYTAYLHIDVKTFISLKDKVESVEKALLDRFGVVTRHLNNEYIGIVTIVPKSYSTNAPNPDPHRPFTPIETKRRKDLSNYLDTISEDTLISEILLPLFRQIGFHRVTAAGHKDKALEYGKDIWMKFTLPSQHVLYFGMQVKKGKLDSAGMSKSGNTNIAEIHHQALMMLGHEIFDPEVSRTVLVDHAFIIAGGEITKAAKNWIGQQLDNAKRSQIMFMDRNDILDLFVVTNLPLPSAAIVNKGPIDDLPF